MLKANFMPDDSEVVEFQLLSINWYFTNCLRRVSVSENFVLQVVIFRILSNGIANFSDRLKYRQ